jgi:hypothetical protein
MTNLWGLRLVISDIHKGVPKEYHRTFDVAHLRLLVVVLTVEQILNAVGNGSEVISKPLLNA